VFDGATPAHLTEAGRLLDALARQTSPLFVVGSSGAEYALTQWWRELEGSDELPRRYELPSPVDRVLAISGSASRLSAQQIDAAIEAGFVDMPVDAGALVGATTWERVAREMVAKAVAALQRGRSVIAHTARGPDDGRIGRMLDAVQAQGRTRAEAKLEGGRLLGVRLGHIARDILRLVPLRRLLLAGGDTSSQITKVLAPTALVVAARLVRGAPLCRFVAANSHLDGLEVALKGGQAGDVNFFEDARRGNS
jgi:uncharacterized protein YgbK (DUF1537 family)